MSDADEFLDFQFGENSFIETCLGNEYTNDSATPSPPTPGYQGSLSHPFGQSFPPGPVRSPRRRGRPVANNAARERTRVKTLRSAFLDLQRTLPAVPPDTKLSKLDVLVLATTYIAHLMSALADDRDISQIFAANGCMHPVKKWPMRTRLYAGILSSTVPQQRSLTPCSMDESNNIPWFNSSDSGLK